MGPILQSRYYDSEVCRFINRDDVSILQITQGSVTGGNLYAYCENNPVNRVDLTGYVVTPANVIGAVIGLVLGAVGGYFSSRFLADKIGPYIAKKFKALLNGLRGLFKSKFGTQLGRLGTLTRNTKPVMKG